MLFGKDGYRLGEGGLGTGRIPRFIEEDRRGVGRMREGSIRPFFHNWSGNELARFASEAFRFPKAGSWSSSESSKVRSITILLRRG